MTDVGECTEPLWDPVRSEVQLLMREYFKRADAEWESAEQDIVQGSAE